MAKSEIIRTTPEQDDIPNPFFAEVAKRAAEAIYGKPDILPTKWTELAYMSGQEHYVEQLVAQNVTLATGYDVKMALRDFEPGEEGQTALHSALTESIGRVVESISENVGVTDLETRTLQMDRSMLEKWIRAMTVLTLKRQTYGETNLSNEEMLPVVSAILGDKDPTKWKRSKIRKELEGAYFHGEESFVPLLQEYLDKFDAK